MNLISFRHLHMLQSMASINANFTIFGTSKNDWWIFAELYSCLRCVDLGSIGILIKVSQDWGKDISLQVPNLNSTIICNGSKYWWSLRRPINIVNLLFQRLNLMTSKFRPTCLLSIPNFNSPIVGTSQEDRAQFLIEEGVTSEFVDWTSMPSIRFIILSIGHRALMDSAVFSCYKVH